MVDLVLRPLAERDVAELVRIQRTPEVACWWGAPDPDFPEDEPEATRLTIEVDGAVAGMIQFAEELEPRYRHAGIDLFLDPALHGRGLGTEAVRRVVRHLVDERGHHRITIDPAAANGAAIRAYEKAGFRPAGVLRRYERDSDGDGWHDGLLMELIADDEPADDEPADDEPADDEPADVLAELRALEPLFHRFEPGTTIAEVEVAVAEDFSEIGASGGRYDRDEVLDVLRERLANPPEEGLRGSEFAVRELAADVFLLTYALDEGARPTRRSTIWRRTPQGWSVEFHQGTIVSPVDR